MSGARGTQTSGLAQYIPEGSKVVWVASTGGHIEQLRRLADSIHADDDSLWITFQTPQTESLLSSCRVQYVDYIAPRDLSATLRAAKEVFRTLNNEHFDFCVSTGAAIAAAVLPQAAARRIDTSYVESVSRVSGPSLTGRMMRWTPGVSTFTQHKRWASDRWPYLGSVLDSWVPYKRSDSAEMNDGMRIFVTLGTIRPFRFDRAVDAVAKIVRESDNVTWQLGATTRDKLPGTVYEQMPAAEFDEMVKDADVVVTHAGVGSLMKILDAGKLPVIAVREPSAGEHVDHHQRQIADELISRGLAVELAMDKPHLESLMRARSYTVRAKGEQAV